MRFKINQKQYDLICERLILNEQLKPKEEGLRKLLDYFGVLESEVSEESLIKMSDDLSSKYPDRLGIKQLESIGIEVRWGRSFEKQLEILLSDSKAMEAILKSISRVNPAQASKIADTLVLESIGKKNYENLEQVYAAYKKLGGETKGLDKIKQVLEKHKLITNQNRYLFDTWKPKDVPLNSKMKTIFEPPPPPKNMIVPSVGIPISSKDFNMIVNLADDIYTGIVKENLVQYSPKNGRSYDVEVKVFPFPGDLAENWGYANTRIAMGQVVGREVWINSNFMKSLGREGVQDILMHEFTHIADPIKYKIKVTKDGFQYYSGSGEKYMYESRKLNKEVEELITRQNWGEKGLESQIQALRDKIQYNFEMYMISPVEHTAKKQSVVNNIVRRTNEILGNKMDNLRFVKAKDFLYKIKKYLMDKNALLPIEYQNSFGRYNLTYYEMIRNNPKYFREQKNFSRKVISQIDEILKRYP